MTKLPTSGYAPALPLACIAEHPKNPRQKLRGIKSLAASIREEGVLEAITVTPKSLGKPTGRCPACGRTSELLANVVVEHETGGEACPGGSALAADLYETVFGHRRRAASLEAGHDTIPAVVRTDLKDVGDQLLKQVVENTQRDDFSLIEEAVAYEQLDLAGIRSAAVAQRTGLPRRRVSQVRHLLELPESTRVVVHVRQLGLDEAIAMGEFASDARVLARLEEAAGSPDFAHQLARARQARDRAPAQPTPAPVSRREPRPVEDVDLGPSCTWGLAGNCQEGKHGACQWSRTENPYGTDDGRSRPDPQGHSWMCPCECHAALQVPPCASPEHQPVEPAEGENGANTIPAPVAPESQPRATTRDDDKARDELRRDLSAAAQVRGDFLAGVMAGRKEIPRDVADELVDLLLDALASGWVETDDVDDQDVYLSDAPARARTDRDMKLLAFLAHHLAGETSRLLTPWVACWAGDPVATRWYGLLDRLGYQRTSFDQRMFTPRPTSTEEASA